MASHDTRLDELSTLEIILACGEHEAVLSPYGASLRGYYHRSDDGAVREIVTRYAGASVPSASARARTMPVVIPDPGHKVGGQGDVLIPFPGRVRAGEYRFDGQSLQMDKNDGEGPNAIHGFLRSTVWHCPSLSENSVRFTTSIGPYDRGGYPFALEVEVGYTVDASGLTCAFSVRNVGERAAPVGAGFHPYFTVGSDTINDDELSLPFEAMLEFEDMLPTGGVRTVDGTSMDFRHWRKIGTTSLNNCFLRPVRDHSGRVKVGLRNPESGRAVEVWMNQAFDYVVLYSGDPLPAEHRRRSLAIEPMTCGSDAFNHPEWGLSVLAPGGQLQGSWGVLAT
ncbi:MAG: hypothetical protein LC772_01445 [Chloroflexi bacterium]|nr:hypothetical protein [Chloroflexota bacterium]